MSPPASTGTRYQRLAVADAEHAYILLEIRTPQEVLRYGREDEGIELAMEMWEDRDRQAAERIFKAWYSWAIRSRLEPIKKVARMIMRNLQGIFNAIAASVTNARLEEVNTVIRGLKRTSRGFRSRPRFRNAIYFHLGGLDLYPDSLAHSNS